MEEVIDLIDYENPVLLQCDEFVDCLRSNGYVFVIVRDPLATAVEPDPFLETMQIYFKHKKVGEPSYVWKKIDRPSANTTEELSADPIIIIPQGFRDWKETMDTCGNKMLSTLQVVTEMLSYGFCLQSHAFISKLKSGPHVLVSTATDLVEDGEEGTVIEPAHYDHNFLTIHDSSTFSGLHIWLNGKKSVLMDIPKGCYLVLAGKQMEWLTGGIVLARKYEVIVTNKPIDVTDEAKEIGSDEAKELGSGSWRASSTFYAYLAPNEIMEPFGRFKNTAWLAPKHYSPILARDYIEQFAETNPNQMK